jgi:hypothetical protein
MRRALERLRRVQETLRRLATIPVTDRRIELRVIQCRMLLGKMAASVADSPDHDYDPRDADRMRLLLREIDEDLKRQKSAAGGVKSAKPRKAAAADWQTKIEPRVKRLIAAGKSNMMIGMNLNTETGHKSPDPIRRFAAQVRRRLAATKK